MKTFILLLSFFFPLILGAQNWQNICSPGVTLFNDPTNSIYSFRQDSAKAVPGFQSDSIFRSFKTIRKIQNNQNCYDTVFGSILGDKIYKKSNGIFVFFNSSEDSIFIKTDALLLQSWKLFLLPNSDYIQAIVSAIRTDSVCGIPDQVKVITLQAKDASNQNIPNIFNNKILVLSMNYGLTHIYDFVKFPADTTSFFLKGKSNPPIGLQDFIFQQSCDYNIGDEFHYQNYFGCSLGLTDEKSIVTVLSKQSSVTGDTVIYGMGRCRKLFAAPPVWYQNVIDTILDTIVLHENLFYQNFNKQPLEFNRQGIEFVKNSVAFNDRSSKRFYVDYFKFDGALNCWEFNAAYPYYEYSQGLGQTRYFNQYLYYNDPPGNWVTVTTDNQLVYYRKGTETWGTPIAPDCATLVDIKEPALKEEPGIKVSPNPVLNETEVSVSGLRPDEPAEIILYDFLGRIVSKRHMQSNPYLLERDGIISGIYIIQIIGKSGSVNLTSRIVFN